MDYIASALCRPICPDQAAISCPDQASLLTAMERHGSGLVQMLWRILGNQSDVADAYQETFCRLAVLLNEGKTWKKKAFIYRVAANIAVDMLRRRKRHAEAERKLPGVAQRETDPAAAFARRDELQNLQDAIASLPDGLRNVLVLREFGELDYQTIATSLQITAGTARQYRHRAVQMLSEKLKVPEGNTDHE